MLDHRGDPWPVLSWGAVRAGQPLFPDGEAVGVVHGVCGDLAWFQDRLRLVRFAPNAALPCEFCRCDRGAASFKNMLPTAAWVATIHLPPQPRPSSAPLWDIPGLSLFSVRLDTMHTLDLGVLAQFLGSVLWTLIFDGTVPGASATARMHVLWGRILDLYQQQGVSCRFARIQIGTFCDPGAPRRDFPVLKGKAAENRCFLPVAEALCREFNTGSPRDGARLQCAVEFGKFYRVLGASGRHMTAAAAEEARAAIFAAMNFYQRLCAHATTVQGCRLFNITNKAHFLLHIALRVRELNPELTWAYQFEDLVGRVKRVAMACCSGTRPTRIPLSFMEKYRRVLHVALR
jgi:hypothetical protein